MQGSNRKHTIISGGIVAFLFLPILSTLIYSLSSKWGATILPQGVSMEWYKALFSDERFLQALGRSFKVCTLSLVISIFIVIPAVFTVYYYFPKALKFMELLAIMPFTVPAVVMAVGLLKIYSQGPIVLTGTMWILVGAHFTLALPFLYRGVRNSLEGLNVRELIEAANMLGATNLQAFKLVIVPNLKKGLTTSVLLSFSFLFGEFLYSNLLAGGGYETVQVYLNNMKQRSGHFTSAIVMTYFAFILVTTLGAFKLNSVLKKEK